MPYLTPTRSSATATSEKQRKSGFFGAVKSIFTGKDNKRSAPARRLSILSLGGDSVADSEADKAMQKRRENCLAIRTAKTEPIEVQRLLIDCEFCNPQLQYGRDVDINTPQFTAEDVLPGSEICELAKYEPETQWNVGLREWLDIREWWNTPTAYAVPAHHSLEAVSTEKYFVIYDKFVRRTRVPKAPINLDDTVKILKAGWVGEGTWPTKLDPDDVWSDEEVEQEGQVAQVAAPEASPGADLEDDRIVKFSTTPHPREGQGGLRRVERTGSNASSGSGLDLVPTRSAVSSLISVTDTDNE